MVICLMAEMKIGLASLAALSAALFKLTITLSASLPIPKLRKVLSTFWASGGKRIFTAILPRKPSFAERRSAPLEVPISSASLIPIPISRVLGVPVAFVVPLLPVTCFKMFPILIWLCAW
ncbi:hypothetical protein D3C86_1484420 [compost metagenome]